MNPEEFKEVFDKFVYENCPAGSKVMLVVEHAPGFTSCIFTRENYYEYNYDVIEQTIGGDDGN